MWKKTGSVLARLGDRVGASDAFARAIEAAKDIPIDQHPAWFLIQIGLEQTKAGERESALQTLDLAESSLRSEPGGGPSWHWKNLAEAFTEAGDRVSAERAYTAHTKARRREGAAYRVQDWMYLAPTSFAEYNEWFTDPGAHLAKLRNNPEHEYPGYVAQELARMAWDLGQFRIAMLTKELEWIASWRE